MYRVVKVRWIKKKEFIFNVLIVAGIVFGLSNLVYHYLTRIPTHYPEKVKYALKVAGENRSELQDYIECYSMQEDSLKLKAAYFIVGNMPGHYGLSYKLNSASGDSIDYRLITRKTPEAYRSYLDSIGARFEVAGGAYDIHKITSAFLIENTNLAFEVWEKPWCNHLNFEQFCEYILPYRVQNESLSDWRRYFLRKYQWIGDSVSDPSDTYAVCVYLQDQLKKEVFYDKEYSRYYSGYVGCEILNKVGIGACSQLANYSTMVMRACGIPITSDHVSYWSYGSGHVYNTIHCNDSARHYFFSLSDGSPISFREKGEKGYSAVKVRRRTYGKQQNKISAYKDILEIAPHFEGVNHLDVTPFFSEVDTLQFKLAKLPEDGGLAYLCHYDFDRVRPVEWSEVSVDSVVTFRNTTKRLIYSIMGYRNKEYYPIGYPIYLNKNGETLEKRPDYTQVCDFRATCKAEERSLSRIDGNDHYFNILIWESGWKSIEAKGKPYIFENSKWRLVENPDSTDLEVFYRVQFENMPKQGLYRFEGDNRPYIIEAGKLLRQ